MLIDQVLRQNFVEYIQYVQDELKSKDFTWRLSFNSTETYSQFEYHSYVLNVRYEYRIDHRYLWWNCLRIVKYSYSLRSRELRDVVVDRTRLKQQIYRESELFLEQSSMVDHLPAFLMI